MFSFNVAIHGRVKPQLLRCRKLSIFTFSQRWLFIISFGDFFAKECRSRYFSSASCVVVEEIFTSEARDFGDM